MAEQQSPASTPKKRGFAAVKERYEAKIKELETKLAAQSLTAAPETAEVGAVPAPAAADTSTDLKPYDASRDPLASINENDDVVWLVSRIFGFPGRKSINDRRGQQDKTHLNAERTVEWHNCPFDFTHPNPDQHRQNLQLNKMWWSICVTRTFAEEVYGGYDGMPQRAVIAPEDFRGIDGRTGRTKGTWSQPSNDPLREYVRYILQSAARNVWFNCDVEPYHERGICTLEKPNPYGEGVASPDVAPSNRPAEFPR